MTPVARAPGFLEWWQARRDWFSTLSPDYARQMPDRLRGAPVFTPYEGAIHGAHSSQVRAVSPVRNYDGSDLAARDLSRTTVLALRDQTDRSVRETLHPLGASSHLRLSGTGRGPRASHTVLLRVSSSLFVSLPSQ
jgi:hypothetical protein